MPKTYKEVQAATIEALKPRVTGRHFGTNRSQRRRRVIDRSFTATGEQVVFTDLNDRVVIKKADHMVNDYRLQRIVWDGSNHERMIVRKAFRAARKANNGA